MWIDRTLRATAGVRVTAQPGVYSAAASTARRNNGRGFAVIAASFPFSGDRIMKTALAFAAVAALALATSSADAKGCLKGAAVGGVAGHYAGHHGMLGAAAGCLYGRHHANEQEKQQQTRGNPRDAQGKM
jgi:hypothetical protein